MYQGKKIVAFIPARGGSKGIKDKNIVSLAGKPLIGYTIEAAKKSAFIDDVMISTDSEKIEETARKYGGEVPFLRASHLAEDTSKIIDSVLDTIEKLKEMGKCYDVFLLLQPTQPLRTTEDIDGALSYFIDASLESLVSVSEVSDPPVLIRSLGKENQLIPLLHQSSTVRRQDMKPYYRVNGCIYINWIHQLSSGTSFNDNQTGYLMDRLHSIDIDEILDLWIAETILSKRQEINACYGKKEGV